MTGPCHSLGVLILLGLSGIYPTLAALPDFVLRITPTSLSTSDRLSVKNDEAFDSLEFLVRRAQFGSRKRFLEGTLVRPPNYDFFLCERYRTNIEVDRNGKVGIVTLPPYQKPDDKNSTIMLVPRGECSFQRKAYAAKHFYGAKGIMVYDRLGARYTWNETTDRVNFPQAMLDYECGNGNSMMHNLALDLPAYNGTELDSLMGLRTKIPEKPATTIAKKSTAKTSNTDFDFNLTTACDLTNTALNPCDSNLCLVASHLENSTEYPVCCAWDTPVTMPLADDAKDLNTDDILSVWVTIRQSELIFQSDVLHFGSTVTIEARGSNHAFNTTYILMWIWGTLVTTLGAWYAAGDYRRFDLKLKRYIENEEQKETSDHDHNLCRPHRKKIDKLNNQSISGNQEQVSLKKNLNSNEKRGKFNLDRSKIDLERGERNFQDEIDDRFASEDVRTTNRSKKQIRNIKANKEKTQKPKQNQEVWSLRSLPPPERKSKQKSLPNGNNVRLGSNTNQSNTEEVVGNEASKIPARESGTITPFEMTHWHVASFIVMASLTLIFLFFFPQIYNIVFAMYGIGCAGAISYLIFNPFVATVIPKFGDSWVEEFNKPVICGCNGFSITSQLIAYIWCGVWIWYGITHYRPETNTFFWISLNILGACFCILCLSMLKLTSIKIATMLLAAIFFYDIFFVFITPFLTGGTSVMLHVASGSDNPNGEDFCYKYPNDSFCTGIKFLPMLFIFPKVNDYAHGSVILGLGDIILPGFIIAFSARHDEAARLVGAHTPNQDIKVPMKWYEGLFFPMVMAYSFGLFSAFLAVILMEQGQPALLYICPICLATIFILGRKDIKDLWNGAMVFKLADNFITKTERQWGKTRMREFAAQLRRKNASQATSSGNRSDPKRYSNERPIEQLKEEQATSEIKSTSSDHIQPRAKDVCFGYEDHPGTRALIDTVEQVAADFYGEEYKPEIYRVIRKKLKGRRFFMNNSSVWAEASKLETRKHIGRAYDRARGRCSKVLQDSDPLSTASH